MSTQNPPDWKWLRRGSKGPDAYFCLALSLMMLLACGRQLHAMFVRVQLESVPIDRVLKNLEREVAANPNDVAHLYQLARIHSMAYASGTNWVDVRTNTLEAHFLPFSSSVPDKVFPTTNPQARVEAESHLTNAIFYYQKAAKLVFTGSNYTAQQWLICPIHLGLAWSLEQAGRRIEAIKAYRKALALAWDLEVHDQPTLKEQAEWSWDLIRAKKNPVSRPPARGSLGPGPCYSKEIIGYLLKILDPVKDAKEIAQLKKDEKTLDSMPRAVTPILVSLQPGAALEELVNPAAGVSFDLDGSGLQRQWGWITPKAGWLVFDKNGDGCIASGLQMFGNVTFWIFWRDGYDALRALDDDGDGMLRGEELRGISIWQDINGNGICEPGEIHPVTELGVVAIDCNCRRHESGIPFNACGMILRDGTVLPTYDWISRSTEAQPLTSQ